MPRDAFAETDLLLRRRPLEEQLSQACAEVAALKAARDVAMRLCTWGGIRRQPIAQSTETHDENV